MQYRRTFSLILYNFFCLVLLQADLASCRRSFKEQRNVGFSSIYAFGDSYTDNHSFDRFYESNSNEIDPSSLHPSTSKTISRSADGFLWVEYLADMLGGDMRLFDFARSGSTANNDILPRNTEDMDSQVDRYLNTPVASTSKTESLFLLWTGVNDINDLKKEFEISTPQRESMLVDIVATIEHDWRKLYEAGATYIVFIGLIPLEELPMYHSKSSSFRNDLRELVLEYNDRLKSAMDRFQTERPDVHAFFFDTYGLFKQLFSPEELEENAVRHCNSETNCDDYIWWDKLHPSSKTHHQIAHALVEAMQHRGYL